MRVCPECGTQTESKVCPKDGLRTIGEDVLAPQDQLIGRTVAQRYTVESAIGKGGMGAVYRARHEETGGLVALKVLHRDRAGSPEAIKRFHLEAQNAAVLRHSNTVRILDFGVDAQLMYLVMEYLHGETLGERLKRVGALPWQAAADIARQVLSALWEAHEHERRIVHRDIKPANIFLVEQPGAGEVAKVLDFGVARSLEGTGAGTQGMIGTPKAMAPEQWRGEQVDARADLYSVGCVLYEMLAGRAPFVADPSTPTSDQIVRMAHAHAHELPPPLQRAAASRLPEGLVRLAHLLLEKDPARRPQSARATLELLDRACQGDPLASGIQPVSEMETLDGDTGETAAPGRLPARRHWQSAVITAEPAIAPGRRHVSATDQTALPAADLPQAWDAPAPRRRAGQPTMFMTVDGEAPVGAAELTVDGLVTGAEPLPYGRADAAAPGPASLPTPADLPFGLTDGPLPAQNEQGWAVEAPADARPGRAPSSPHPAPAHRHAPSEVPWLRGEQADLPAPSHRASAARQSGGWGDELFGDAEPRPHPTSGGHAAPELSAGLNVVTSEERPHPIPETPVVPQAASPSSAQPRARRERDGKGAFARLLVLIIVGGALYGGGKFAWERLQQRPPSAMEAATAPVDVPPAPVPAVAAPTLEEEDDRGEMRPQVVYRARISKRDHLDARGHKLRGTWRVLIRDRERLHELERAKHAKHAKHGKHATHAKPDKGDTSDPRYGSKKARAALQKLLRARRLPDEVRRAVSKGTPLLEVQVWPDQVTVKVLEP